MINEKPFGTVFHLAQCIGALSIEVNTGMKHSKGSVLKLAQTQYGVKARTKKKALEELKAMYKETTGWEYGDSRKVPESVDPSD